MPHKNIPGLLLMPAFRRNARFAALSFLFFILLLIATADAGRLPGFIHGIYRFPQGDRVGHVVLYGILAFLLARAFPRPFRIGRFRPPISFAALLVFTVTEEWSQAFFAARTSDGVDLACSCIGLLAGTWAACRRPAARENIEPAR